MSDRGDEPPGAGRGDGEPGPEPVGSVGEEAAKLFGAFTDLARDRAPSSPGTGWSDLAAQAAHAGRAAQDAVHEIDAHLATGSAECRWCPVCRVVHAVRESTSPEVRAHLTVAVSSLLQAAAQLLEPPAPPAEDSGGTRRGGASGHDVEHIDLDDRDVRDDDTTEERG